MKNVGLLWKETGDQVTWDLKKTEIRKDFFWPCFSLASAPARPPKSQKAKAVLVRMKNYLL